MIRNATISDCGKFRYDLTRAINGRTPSNTLLGVCMLNPSTADGETDDATIRRLLGYAERNRFGGIYVVNCYAFRATNPNELRTQPADVNVIGDLNFAYIQNAAMMCEKILVGWGALKKFPDPAHSFKIADMLKKYNARLVCLGRNLDGSPVHPLYQPNDAQLVSWSYVK